MALTRNYIYCKLTLKLKESPYTTLDLYFGNEAAEAGDLYSGSPKIYKIFKNVSDLGSKMDVVLPKFSGGSLVLNNNRGTLRYDKRLSDYLEKYSFIKQPLVFYTFFKQEGATGDSENETQEFNGVVSGVSFSSKEITLNFRESNFATNSPQYLIKDAVFPNAPDRSLDAYLPVVFGDQEVKAYPTIDEDSDDFNNASAVYLYATTYGTDFVNGGVQDYLVKDNLGRYVSITPGATTSTEVYDSLGGGGEVVDIWEGVKQGQQIVSTSGGIWFDKVRLYLNDGGDTNRDGTFTIAIHAYNKSQTGTPVQKIDEVTVNSSATVNISGNNYYLDFDLTNLIIVGQNRRFYLEISHDPDTGSDNLAPVKGDSSVANVVKYIVDDFNDDGSWRQTIGKPFKVSFYGPTITDAPTPGAGDVDDVSGLGFSKFTINRDGANGDGPDITTLDILVNTRGLKDDSSGTITGTAETNLNTAKNAVKLLYYKQNGDSLTGFDDISYAPDNYLTTNINGATVGKTTYREMIKDILRENTSKLVPRKGGKLAYWSYGYTTHDNPLTVPSAQKFIQYTDFTEKKYNTESGGRVTNSLDLTGNGNDYYVETGDVDQGGVNYTDANGVNYVRFDNSTATVEGMRTKNGLYLTDTDAFTLILVFNTWGEPASSWFPVWCMTADFTTVSAQRANLRIDNNGAAVCDFAVPDLNSGGDQEAAFKNGGIMVITRTNDGSGLSKMWINGGAPVDTQTGNRSLANLPAHIAAWSSQRADLGYYFAAAANDVIPLPEINSISLGFRDKAALPINWSTLKAS